MKKNIEFKNRNLSLNKETIARLNDEQLKSIAGGKESQPPPTSSCDRRSCHHNTAAAEIQEIEL